MLNVLFSVFGSIMLLIMAIGLCQKYVKCASKLGKALVNPNTYLYLKETAFLLVTLPVVLLAASTAVRHLPTYCHSAYHYYTGTWEHWEHCSEEDFPQAAQVSVTAIVEREVGPIWKNMFESLWEQNCYCSKNSHTKLLCTCIGLLLSVEWCPEQTERRAYSCHFLSAFFTYFAYCPRAGKDQTI